MANDTHSVGFYAAELLDKTAERKPNKTAIIAKEEELTFAALNQRVHALAGHLQQAGIRQGDRVGVLLPNSTAIPLSYYATQKIGAVTVILDARLKGIELQSVLTDADLKLLVAHSQLFPEVEEAFKAMAPVPLWIVGAAGERSFEAKFSATATSLSPPKLKPGDDALILYTSGTTGEPKGVVLTHENLVYEAWAIRNVVPVDETDEQLLVLPLAHIFARHLVWGAVEQGAVTAVGEGEPQIAANLLEVAPTFMGAVPRMYELAHARVMREVIGRSPVTRRGFELALEVGRRLSSYRQRGQVPPTSLQLRGMVADRLFFARIRALFGGRLRFFVCGGAALNQEIAEFFHACGVLILEGYGLSETTGATNVNRPDRFRFGTVGPAMPGCEIRIADDGEVLVRGHNVMRGYLERPEETAAAFDEHGWLRTGDIGELRDGFLKITDRKKSLFKTTGGKYVAPRMVEGRLRVKEGIGHALVHGEGRPFPIALVSLDVEALLQRSDEEGLGCRTYADLAVHPRVQALVQEHVDAVNATLARWETIRRFAIVPRPFTVESGELTPTRKLRRAVIAQRYAEVIEDLYAGADLQAAES
jgi:long-chain acyl-CoA synthetase